MILLLLTLLLTPAQADVMIREQDGFRYIKTDTLPDHATGQFPNSGNPHSIQAKNRTYRVSLTPQVNDNITENNHNLFGVALNGVPFDPATAEYWRNDRGSEWNIQAFAPSANLGIDQNNAHVQPDGTYHYHGIPSGLLGQLDRGKDMTLVGWAADGFPIYGPLGYDQPDNPLAGVRHLQPSYRLKQGYRPTSGPRGQYDGTYTADYEYIAGSGDLGRCNERFGTTPEFSGGIMYYVLTTNYPHIPRCWVGTPDETFMKQRSEQGAARPSFGGHQRPPHGHYHPHRHPHR